MVRQETPHPSSFNAPGRAKRREALCSSTGTPGLAWATERDANDSEPVSADADRVPLARLNLNLPRSLHEDLVLLARQLGKSLTELVRLGLGIVFLAYTELKPGYKLAICDSEDRVVKELLLPI